MYSTNKRRFSELSIESTDENTKNNKILDYSEYYIKIGNKRQKISSLHDSIVNKDI